MRNVVTGAGLLVLIAACSTGGSGGVSSGNATSSSGFAREYCDVIQPCCAEGGFRTDGAICRGLVEAVAGSSSYDPQAGSACINEAKAALASPTRCATAASTPSCKRVFSSNSSSGGTKKPGEACTTNSDCATSAEGDVRCATLFKSGGASEEYCQLQVLGKAGDTGCYGTKDPVKGSSSFSTSGDAPIPRIVLCDASQGLTCNTTDKTCTARGKTGDPCTSSDSCDASSMCDFATKKCVDRLADGADCSKSSTACREGSYCATDKKCTAKAADGTPCTSGSNCLAGSCVNGKCGSSSSSSFAFLCGKP